MGGTAAGWSLSSRIARPCSSGPHGFTRPHRSPHLRTFTAPHSRTMCAVQGRSSKGPMSSFFSNRCLPGAMGTPGHARLSQARSLPTFHRLSQELTGLPAQAPFCWISGRAWGPGLCFVSLSLSVHSGSVERTVFVFVGRLFCDIQNKENQPSIKPQSVSPNATSGRRKKVPSGKPIG